MQFLKIVALAAFAATLALAQQTRDFVTKPTTDFEDSKPNSAAVPEGYATSGQFERIVVFRFKYQTDLLKGIEDLVAKQKIHNAVILSGIGSVRNSHVHAVSNRDFPSQNVFIKDPDTPADIISINGYVIEGRVHAHMTLSDENKAFGGHIEPDTNVLTFAIVTLGVFDDSVDLSRVDDKTYR